MSEVEERAQRLQEALDRLSDGESVDDALQRLGDDKDLADDLVLAWQMKGSLPTAPSAEFRARTQAALQGMMPTVPPASGRRLIPRLAGAVAAVVLVLWSAVVVSADSLPGDALYGVKLARERTQLALAVNPAARARVYLDMADNRLSELEEMADRGLPLPATLVDDLVAAQGAALDQAESSGDASLLQEAEDSATRAGRSVSQIAKDVPRESRDLLKTAGMALRPAAQATDGPAGAHPSATAQSGPTIADVNEPTSTSQAASDGPELLLPTATYFTIAATATATATAADAPPTAGAGATLEPTIPAPTQIPPTVAPPSTDEADPEATLPPTIAAIFTERAEEATAEAEPTATRTPGSGRRHMAPTPEPTPTATDGAVSNDDPTSEPSSVPTDPLDPPPTSTAGP